eukprot:scaffold4335_cov119-Cylindrotheca_fusiformis.AAC.10
MSARPRPLRPSYQCVKIAIPHSHTHLSVVVPFDYPVLRSIMFHQNNKNNNDDVFDEVTVVEFRELDYEESIAAYEESLAHRNISKSKRDEEYAKVLVPLLTMQCYHLPGNTWRQDLRQYVFNNHPIFGICLHHKLHPLGAKTRIVALVGTLMFGLFLTSLFELLYVQYPTYQRILVAFGDAEDGWELTSGMLLLWTVGGAIHTAYNLFMWRIAACSCMREGGCMETSKSCHCPSLGKTFLRIFVIFIAVLTLFVVCFKVVINNDETTEDIKSKADDIANLDNYKGVDDFGFVLAYLVGMALSFFLWYFVGLLILFSGILGCYKLPVLGGRPREVAIVEKWVAKREAKLKKAKSKKKAFVADLEQRSAPNGGRREYTKSKSAGPGVLVSSQQDYGRSGRNPHTASARPGLPTQDRSLSTRFASEMPPMTRSNGSSGSGGSGRRQQQEGMPDRTRSTRQGRRDNSKLNSSRLVFEPL